VTNKTITKHSSIDYLTYQFLQDVLPTLKEYLCSTGAISGGNPSRCTHWYVSAWMNLGRLTCLSAIIQ